MGVPRVSQVVCLFDLAGLVQRRWWFSSSALECTASTRAVARGGRATRSHRQAHLGRARLRKAGDGREEREVQTMDMTPKITRAHCLSRSVN